jgi:hypothetical protein
MTAREIFGTDDATAERVESALAVYRGRRQPPTLQDLQLAQRRRLRAALDRYLEAKRETAR